MSGYLHIGFISKPALLDLRSPITIRMPLLKNHIGQYAVALPGNAQVHTSLRELHAADFDFSPIDTLPELSRSKLSLEWASAPGKPKKTSKSVKDATGSVPAGIMEKAAPIPRAKRQLH
jgi:hypothetical protein